MYPNLYFLIKKLTGLEVSPYFSVVQTFGLFMALAFIASGFAIAADMKRKEKLGLFQPIIKTAVVGKPPSIADLLVNALIGFILGYKFLYIAQNSQAFLEDAQDVVLSSKGSLVGGIVGAVILAAMKYLEKTKEAKQHETVKTVQVRTMPHEIVGDIIIVAAISGLLGAKIFALMETPDEFLKDPIGQLLSGSGLAIYGGLIGGFVAVYLYIKRKGINPIHMMDTAAPAMLLGVGVGRIGCQLSGDGDWGIVNNAPKPSWLPDFMWSNTFPNNVLGQSASTKSNTFMDGNDVGSVLIEGCEGAFYTDKYCYELAQPVWPTSLYEVIALIGLFAFFWFVLRKRVKVAGVLFFLYLIVNSIERYWIETMRVNDRYAEWGNLSQAQIIAVITLLIGIIGVVVLKMRANKGKGTLTS